MSTELTVVRKPGFVSSPNTEAYWEAAEQGELLLQECRECGHHQHYARNLCTQCWSAELEWKHARGLATIWTFTVVHMPGHPAWQPESPYVLALVEVDEGPRLMTNIVGCPAGEVFVGQRVRLSPHRPEGQSQTLLQFRPVDTD